MTDALHHNNLTNWIISKSRISLFYLIGILGFAILCFYGDLMDVTLLPRNACASAIFISVCAFILFKSRGTHTSIKWPPLDLPTGFLLGYFAWCTISVLWATNFSEAIFESQKIIIAFASFYMCRWFQLNDPSFVRRLLKTIILLSVPVLLIALWQILNLDPSQEGALYQISGISGHKNLFSTAIFLLCSFLGMAFLCLTSFWKKGAALMLMAFLILILYLKTRSVYLGVLVALVIFIWGFLQEKFRTRLSKKMNQIILGFITFGVLGFIYLLFNNQLIDLLHASKIDKFWNSDTGYERIILWEKTASVIRHSPLWGVGAGNWQIEFPNYSVHGLYSVETDFTTFQRPHNDWLWVWAETGIIGLICYLGFFIACILKAFKNLKTQMSTQTRLVALTQISVIIGFMVIAFFSFPKERTEILILIFTLMGLVYPVLQRSENGQLFGRLILVVIMISSSLNLFISLHRMKGEKNIKKILLYKQENRWSDLIHSADLAYSRWYTIDPTTVPIHWYRGTANFVLGNRDAALKDYFIAERYAPYNQYVKNDIGTCYEKMGHSQKAKSYFNESIRISPLFDDPRINLGISYFNEGNYVEALDWINSISDYKLKLKYREIIEQRISEGQQ